MLSEQQMRIQPIQCNITVRGRVARHWSRWLGELALCHRANAEDEEVTDLIGTLPDQSALQGVLNRVWRLNLTVLSVSTSPGEAGGDADPPDGSQA
jgi:hypothetical protein